MQFLKWQGHMIELFVEI